MISDQPLHVRQLGPQHLDFRPQLRGQRVVRLRPNSHVEYRQLLAHRTQLFDHVLIDRVLFEFAFLDPRQQKFTVLASEPRACPLGRLRSHFVVLRQCRNVAIFDRLQLMIEPCEFAVVLKSRLSDPQYNRTHNQCDEAVAQFAPRKSATWLLVRGEFQSG